MRFRLLSNTNSTTDKIASTLLGKKIEGAQSYDPSFLVAVPRFENRKQYNIKNEDLPFSGWDVWHAYEFSVMCNNGLPITRVIKLRYNCDNEFLVESKSLKLYLNSFNMTRVGNSIVECLDWCKQTIEKDLSDKLQTIVEINFLEDCANHVEIFGDYTNLVNLVDEKSLSMTKFKEAPELLKVSEGFEKKSYYLKFDSLRSNCRVTHQPDFGDAFIYYESEKHINESSLIEYLTSFRSEYHFHEECCEMIYKRLYDLLDENDKLFVCALYTRRGGIDISPARWSKNFEPGEVDKLIDLSTFARCGIKQ